MVVVVRESEAQCIQVGQHSRNKHNRTKKRVAMFVWFPHRFRCAARGHDCFHSERILLMHGARSSRFFRRVAQVKHALNSLAIVAPGISIHFRRSVTRKILVGDSAFVLLH